jgi:hypothetical protein
MNFDGRKENVLTYISPVVEKCILMVWYFNEYMYSRHTHLKLIIESMYYYDNHVAAEDDTSIVAQKTMTRRMIEQDRVCLTMSQGPQDRRISGRTAHGRTIGLREEGFFVHDVRDDVLEEDSSNIAINYYVFACIFSV